MSENTNNLKCQRYNNRKLCESDHNVQDFKGVPTCEECYDEYIHEVSL